MQYNFEWDLNKAKININKHGVSFERAAEIFLDPLQMVIFDSEHSETEECWVTLGKTTNDGFLLVVVHTFEEHEDSATIRVISAERPLSTSNGNMRNADERRI
ncbi:MAG: BrnT family toxin [Nitrosospira sp.]|nr:BrnT family toxin [Nitrosospira sp.]MDN5880972.1 BrnT family toxin [Nitrosospira sp.]